MQNILIEKLKDSTIGRSFLIYCSDKLQIQRFIEEILKKLKISNIDFYIVSDDSIKISQIRKLQNFISLKPYNSSRKIALIFWGENLTLASANALLKTLEEPAKNCYIFLASRTKKLLPTIISRCQRIRLPEKKQMLSPEEYQSIQKEIESIAKLRIKDKFDLAKNLAEENFKEKLTKWLMYMRTNLQKKSYKNIIKQMFYWQNQLNNSNASQRLIVENLLLLL